MFGGRWKRERTVRRWLDDIQASRRMSELGICVINPAIVPLFVHRRLSRSPYDSRNRTDNRFEFGSQSRLPGPSKTRSCVLECDSCDRNGVRITTVELKSGREESFKNFPHVIQSSN